MGRAQVIIQHTWNQNTFLGYDKAVDLVFADPPYNYRVDYEDDATGDKLPFIVYQIWIASVIEQCVSLLRSGGTLWWLCPAEDGDWTWDLLTEYGVLLHKRPIVWHERFSQYQQTQLTADYRLLFPLVVGDPSKVIFRPDNIREESERQRRGDKRADPRGRVPGHVWQTRRLQGNAKDRVPWHPAQLPPEPLERIICGWTNPGDTVVDAFAGSGSMGVVCKKHGREFVGIEQSEEYCQQMRERIDAKV